MESDHDHGVRSLIDAIFTNLGTNHAPFGRKSIRQWLETVLGTINMYFKQVACFAIYN